MVVLEEPFTFTVAPETKLEPLTVNVVELDPCDTAVGEMLAMFGTGLSAKATPGNIPRAAKPNVRNISAGTAAERIFLVFIGLYS